MRNCEGRGNQQDAAEEANCQAGNHGDTRAGAVAKVANPGTAYKCGNVLDADDETRDDSAIAHAQVHDGRQHRERQPNGEVADEGKVGVAEQPHRAGAAFALWKCCGWGSTHEKSGLRVKGLEQYNECAAHGSWAF